MNSKVLPPRLPSLPARKSAVLSVLDIGTSKIVCLVARLNPSDPSEPLRGRTHRCRILGIGHQRSRGIKGGTVVDMDAAEGAIRFAVDAAERMAGVQVESVIVNATGGRLSSRLYDAKVAIAGRAVTQADVHRVLEACTTRGGQQGRAVLHALPIGFALGETRHIQDPRGMVGDELGADMHVLSCDAAAARNLMLAVERCHLTVDAMVATPYAAGLAALADDEAELGAALIDMGAGTTSVSVFSGGHLTHVDAFAVGGHHVTMDVARGLGITLADAERLKTLYGGCLTSVSDESETIAVVQAGEEDERPAHLPKAQLISIIKPRVEEILELVRDRLEKRGPSRACGAKTRSHRRCLPAHRYAGGGEAHRLRAGTDRPPARHKGAARIREKPGFRRGCRASDLSASERHRAFPPFAAQRGSGGASEWILRAGWAMAQE